jgi:adenine-specific DNA-methyltransferase
VKILSPAFSVFAGAAMDEKAEYLSRQLITYIGNKRALLGFIGSGVKTVQQKLQKNKLKIFDVFSGSGIVARYFKQFSDLLIANDLEKYSTLINECYLSNEDGIDMPLLQNCHREITEEIKRHQKSGIIAELYAPLDDTHIRPGERVFYTRKNAMYIDTARQAIEKIPKNTQKYFLAPLLSEASIHVNTAGVFKGFYKNRETGTGQFGGKDKNAIDRITGSIELPFPIFSNFNCETIIANGDANNVIKNLPEVDLAYLDPPYNQHPYGSNYFMLNLILDYTYPEKTSRVSGIPENWNRSDYNKARHALRALSELVREIKSRYVLISFNSEGFISVEHMKNMLNRNGRFQILETQYNTFRGSRNLGNRNIHVKEYLYLLEKS